MEQDKRKWLLKELGLRPGQIYPDRDQPLKNTGWYLLPGGHYLGSGDMIPIDFANIAIGLEEIGSNQIFCILHQGEHPSQDSNEQFIAANCLALIKRGTIYIVVDGLTPLPERVHISGVATRINITRQGVTDTIKRSLAPARVVSQSAPQPSF